MENCDKSNKNELHHKTGSSIMLIYSWFHTWSLSERVVTAFEWGQLYLDSHYNSNLFHKSDVALDRLFSTRQSVEHYCSSLFHLSPTLRPRCSPIHTLTSPYNPVTWMPLLLAGPGNAASIACLWALNSCIFNCRFLKTKTRFRHSF